MCGIFGYISAEEVNNPVTICLEGLKHLEYRGYDSAGIAGISKGVVSACKTAGRVRDLEQLVADSKFQLTTAIAHTRWATHGKPTHYNAHPHLDQQQHLAIVHNGIIENYAAIKQQLLNVGAIFQSDTDTEVIAHLLAYYYKEDFITALCKVCQELEGSWAFALVHKDHPHQIFAASKDTPLIIGRDSTSQEVFISSDLHAFKKEDLELIYLNTHELAVIAPGHIEIIDFLGNKKEFSSEKLSINSSDTSKGHFEHFMLKEIFEQPIAIKKAMEGRLLEAFGTAHFDDLTLSPHELQSVNRILILGCGTSYHAGCVAASMFANIARIPTEVEIASEFRYSNPIVSSDTLVIAISQSGETADTLASVREAEMKGAKVIGICNVKHSKLTRETDSCLFLNAGPEISVCSTKAFTSQLTVLSLLTLCMARLRHLSKEEGQIFLQDVKHLPHMIGHVLGKAKQIEQLAKKYASFQNFFFVGRRYMYPTSLEAALKLKEISYVNATGYPAGEMKHGPIALIDKNLITVAMCGNEQTYPKLVSNLMEIKARSGPIIAFAPRSAQNLEGIADDLLYLPKISDPLASIPYSVAAQLFAYYIAKERGTDIDKPRNLAKSVTVE